MSLADKSFLPTESPHSARGACLSHSRQTLIREQLDRILASSLFRNSKRFPEFLRYTVEQALQPGAEHLKERTIGAEVFGREPDYDTSGDPVVRMTATEVRRRLRQYYEEIGHEHELRIEFSRGSYIPEFKFTAEIAASRVPTITPTTPIESKMKRPWFAALVLLILCVILLTAFWVGTARQTALDRFLSPVTIAKVPVLLCIPGQNSDPGTSPTAGQSGAIGPPQPTQPATGVADRVSFSDAMALATVGGAIAGRGTEFRVRHTGGASLDDLKDGPVVLIGGYTNRWTMELEGGLRFNFAVDGTLHYIADRQNAGSRDWSSPDPSGSGRSFSDYALISRVMDRTTGRVLVTVAGIRRFGTQSAADCFLDSKCFEDAERLAPGDWKKANIQVVLKVPVIDNAPGQPQVIAARIW